MKQIATVDAVGTVLCHDHTRIVKDVEKGVAFRKGHVVRSEDIPVLLAMGKDHLFVWDLGDDMLHENDAAAILQSLAADPNMTASSVKEGKIELTANLDGLLVADVNRIDAINRLGEICLATRHSGFAVKQGDKLAGFRVIPLAVAKTKMDEVRRIAGTEPLLRLLPFKPHRVGVVTTGNEIYHGRITDAFTPVVAEKFSRYGSTIVANRVCDDNLDRITDAIRSLLDEGVDFVVCTGGMSVDPDDLTPGAIRASGADIVSYGAPVLPGAMFLMAYHGDVPVVGLPGCVMYAGQTIFDIILPRILAGRRVTREEILNLGNGGLCLGCKPCIFPACGFGKGHSYV
ncbi:MAG: molybdopterin-binding protein [Planctomycetaceae bacterium]|nr:molybdopterin-binding protein [Planctomycetaceae bacterium]